MFNIQCQQRNIYAFNYKGEYIAKNKFARQMAISIKNSISQCY